VSLCGITVRCAAALSPGSFGSPTIANDLHVFDQQWGFPDPELQVMKFGNVPPFDPNDSTMVGWAQETTLDVEYAHAIAPGAKIVLAETPVAEVEGTSGLPEMMNAEESLIDRGIGDVITQSFGATENTFPGFDSGNFSSLLNLRYAFKDALAHGVTVLASSGDDGATDAESDASTLYPFRVNSWPSSDPLVTSVGGTQLHLDNSGNRLSPDVVWNDGFGAGGGGLSGVFKRPVYQIGVTKEVGKQRGTPDISMSAAVDGGAWVYYSFLGTASPWHIFGGTSEASPIFSGIVALANQALTTGSACSTRGSTSSARSASTAVRAPESWTLPPVTTPSPASQASTPGPATTWPAAGARSTRRSSFPRSRASADPAGPAQGLE
jgi:subtilase family serine protease